MLLSDQLDSLAHLLACMFHKHHSKEVPMTESVFDDIQSTMELNYLAAQHGDNSSNQLFVSFWSPLGLCGDCRGEQIVGWLAVAAA